MSETMREEQDALGTLSLSNDVYYGVQTERARRNFPVTDEIIAEHPSFIWSLAAIKKATILTHKELGEIEEQEANAMNKAADEVMNGELDNHFPLDMFVGGGGTPVNMNMNEVIANRANEILTGKKGYDRISPNNHVNMSQSTNDVIPSAMKLTMYTELNSLLDDITKLEVILGEKMEEYKNIVKISRTCLQDAVPITIGQEYSGYLSYFKRQKQLVKQVATECLIIPLGATAIGTELGAKPGYVDKVYDYLSDIFDAEVTRDPNFFDGIQNMDVFTRVSSALKGVASGLSKIGSDFRFFSSGPRAGIGEIVLPALQPGSSIMPGKVNPVMADVVNQVYAQVSGNDTAISIILDKSEPDIGMFSPAIIKWLNESIKVIKNSIPLFIENCIAGIVINEDVCKTDAESSGSLSVVISILYGYKEGSRVAKHAYANNVTVKEAAIELGIMNEAEADRLLDPLTLTNPELSRDILFADGKVK